MKFLIKSNLFVALCTASLTAQTYVLCGKKPDFLLLASVFLSTVFVYCFHRLIKATRSEKQISLKHGLRGNQFFAILSAISLLALLPIIFQLGPSVWIFFVFVGMIAIWYSLGFFTINGRVVNLRNVPYIKAFIIAFTWAMMTVALPLLNVEKSIEFYFYFIERFIFVLAITIPFDIRDMREDAAEGLKTIPLTFGLKRAIYFNYGLIIFFALSMVLAFYVEIQSIQITLALIISAIFTFIMISKTHIERHSYFFNLGMEGMSLLQSILVCASLLI